MPVVVHRKQHVILIRHVLHNPLRRRVVKHLLPDQAKLLAKVRSLRVGDLSGGGEGGDLLADVDEEVRELVQAESTVLADVAVEDVPANISGQ